MNAPPVPEPVADPAPPARRAPTVLRSPFGSRIDDYAWLRDDARENPEVLAYLAAENAHHDAYMARLKPATQKLYDEIIGRLRQDDESVPVFERGYWYYVRYETGKQYPVHARRKGTLDAPEQVLLDENVLSAGHEYFDIGSYEVSDDNRTIAWTEDVVGRREYVLRFRDLQSARDFPDRIENVEDDIAWAADARTVLYVAKHPQTLLGYRVNAHQLGTPAALDRCLYEQLDESYYTAVYRGRSMQYVYIVVSSTVASEYRYARADDPELAFRVVLERRRDHEYHVEDQFDEDGSRFLILSNAGAPNFRLLTTPVETASNEASWRELIAHRNDVFLTGFDVFRHFVAVGERAGPLQRVRILPAQGVPERVLVGNEPAGMTVTGENPDYDTQHLRYGYTSPTTPFTTYEVDVATGATTLLKVEPVVGGFDASRYATELVWAPARDGARVPVTLFYARGFKRDGTAPVSYTHLTLPTIYSV